MAIKDKIKAGRLRLKLDEAQFAELIGVTRGAVQQWEKGTTAPNRSRQPTVATAIGLTVAELMSEDLLAHPMGYEAYNVPLVTQWGELRAMKKLPKSFTAPMPDDSMKGSIEKGTALYFETGPEPEPGEGVLVEDKHNEWHVRRFKKAAGNRFIAEAQNIKDYESLDSEREGLKVLAVLRGVLSGKI